MSVKKILIATLNWGLGHTARSIPIINHLRAQGHEIYLASDGVAGIFLQEEFPTLPYVELPSYHIHYSSESFYWHWCTQLPHINRAINLENKCLSKLIRNLQIDTVISDNRYGLYHESTQNIIITHQISFDLDQPIAWITNSLVRRMINRFDTCWIPDNAGDSNLSGKLSEGDLAISKCFIGPLSRMQKASNEIKYDICIVLSGPEPMRSKLQAQLIKKFENTPLRVAMVMGMPGSTTFKQTNRVDFFNHLPTHQLNNLLNQSSVIISRAGYSSIMDYFILNKKAILIPTPLQPEQMYLAARHNARAEFYMPQPDLSDLHHGIAQLSQLKAQLPNTEKTIVPEI